MSAIALVVLAGIIVPQTWGGTSFQEQRYIFWANPNAEDPMKNEVRLLTSWMTAFNPQGVQPLNEMAMNYVSIPVHNMRECDSYAVRLMNELRMRRSTRDKAFFKEAKCIFIPNGYVLDNYNDGISINIEDGSAPNLYASPYALKKLPTPQEIAKKEWDEAHPDCLHISPQFPWDDKENDLIEPEGKVEAKCLLNKGSDNRYYASQCKIVNVTLNKSYKKKLEKLYKSQFAESTMKFLDKMCMAGPVSEPDWTFHISFTKAY